MAATSEGKPCIKGSRVLIASAVLLVLSSLMLAYSFTVTWSASSSVTVYSTSLDLKVYWDSACTDPVTSIDFGNVQKSTSKTVYMYIRNEGNGTVIVHWNSTRPSVTSYIAESWERLTGLWSPLDGHSLGMGTTLQTRYTITVNSNCPSGQYSWTLSLGADPL